jgi:hypothetical protein
MLIYIVYFFFFLFFCFLFVCLGGWGGGGGGGGVLKFKLKQFDFSGCYIKGLVCLRLLCLLHLLFEAAI